MCSNRQFSDSENYKAIASQACLIVSGFIKTSEMFTAYDVTVEMRKIVGTLTPIHHADVREAVQSLYRKGLMGSDYERAPVEISKGVCTFVYHHYQSDPKTYRASFVPAELPQSQSSFKVGSAGFWPSFLRIWQN